MNVKVKWECPGCYAEHETEDLAHNCHPIRKIFMCGHCGDSYDDEQEAELCGLKSDYKVK